MSPAEWTAIVLLAAWLVLSALVQFEAWPAGRWMRRVDLFGLLPVWRPITPQPPGRGYHLLWRPVTSADVPLTRWIELRVARPYQPWRLLWNPTRRDYGALVAIAARLQADGLCDPAIEASGLPSYRRLLRHVAHQIPAHVERFQFAVLARDVMEPGDRLRRIVTSQPHHVREVRAPRKEPDAAT